MEALNTSPRRLLFIDPSDACGHLLAHLRVSGWTIERAGLSEANASACDVGLVHVGGQHVAYLHALRALIQQHEMEWVAILDQEAWREPAVSRFVSDWFFDYHSIPADDERLYRVLERAAGVSRIRAAHLKGKHHEPDLLGNSRMMKALRKSLATLAGSESALLIQGENGTGKELFARKLHQQAKLSADAFFTLDGATYRGSLSQLDPTALARNVQPAKPPQADAVMRHRDSGTLFIKNVADLTMPQQIELLHKLQHTRLPGVQVALSRCRVLAATDKDLLGLVRQGSFSEPLYHQLSAVQVHACALRERGADLGLLAEHFAKRYSLEMGRRPRRFSEDALSAIQRHAWPGNVRELANRVRRSVALAEGRQIEAKDLLLESSAGMDWVVGTLSDYILRAERQALNDVLLRYSKNMSQAARVLGVSRPTFYRLLHKHQIR